MSAVASKVLQSLRDKLASVKQNAGPSIILLVSSSGFETPSIFGYRCANSGPLEAPPARYAGVGGGRKVIPLIDALV